MDTQQKEDRFLSDALAGEVRNRVHAIDPRITVPSNMRLRELLEICPDVDLLVTAITMKASWV